MKLNTRNYQAGIDLGTTNSAVSVINEKGINILEVSGGSNLLPSCVYFSKDQNKLVGLEAKNMLARDPANGHSVFKRKMGTSIPYPVERLNTTLLAEELSGLILRKLQEVYKSHHFEDLLTAIITVPARFDLKAVDATRIAAMGNFRANGSSKVNPLKKSDHYSNFLQIETLMEPVAASIAYGIEKDMKDDGKWLVFDLGGGTFDAAVVTCADGSMDIKYHGGNNFLGGIDFDRKILSYINERLNEKYSLDNLLSADKYRIGRSILLNQIEKLKIELSERKEVVLSIKGELKDNKGKDVVSEIVITRDEYNTMIGPLFQQTIDICHNIFRQNKLAPSDLDRVLLVGGPTQYPYFGQQIKDQLKIDIDTSVNPMTAVAVGASVYGSSRELPEEVKPEIIEIISRIPADCQLEINCPNSTQSTSELLTGKLILSEGNFDLVESISIKRFDGGWESGAIDIDQSDGTFFSDLHLKENIANVFHIQVNGKKGTAFTVSPTEFQIMHNSIVVGSMVAPYSLNVTEEGNVCKKVIKKDTELPATGTETFYTTREISKDDGGEDILFIEITEGESENPRENIHIGTLNIPGTDLRRTLPINTALEVSIEESSDRNITATCYITFTRQTFDAVLNIKRKKTEIKDIEESYNNLVYDYENSKKDLKEYGSAVWQKKYDGLRVDNDMDKLKILMENDFKASKAKKKFVESDVIHNIKSLITDVKLNLEEFYKEFARIVIAGKIKKMENSLSGESELNDKLGQWKERLASFEGSELSKETIDELTKEIRNYDKDFIGFSFLIKLDMFTSTKMNNFVQGINELKNAAVQYSNYTLILTMSEIISDWNDEIKRTHYNVLTPYYNRFEYNIREVLDKLDDEDLYVRTDYDKVVKVMNQYTNPYDLKIIEKLAKQNGARRDVLRKAIDFAKAYTEGYIDKIDEKYIAFGSCYFVDPGILPKGSLSSGSAGPAFRS